MLLSNLDAAVTQQHRNALHRYTCLKQSHSERIPEAVGVAVRDPRFLEYAL
jgi:hypothetical protein